MEKIGKGRATVYQISSYYKLFIPIADSYFDNDLDQRDGATQFNLEVIELINGMQEIKLNNAEKQMRWNWEDLQVKLFKIAMDGLKLEQWQKQCVPE